MASRLGFKYVCDKDILRKAVRRLNIGFDGQKAKRVMTLSRTVNIFEDLGQLTL